MARAVSTAFFTLFDVTDCSLGQTLLLFSGRHSNACQQALQSRATGLMPLVLSLHHLALPKHTTLMLIHVRLQVMTVNLTADHRVVYGAQAAEFLQVCAQLSVCLWNGYRTHHYTYFASSRTRCLRKRISICVHRMLVGTLWPADF